ncbi:MAG: transporter substrate-binding domain-containing protein [Deltaproteobacteria bacterium]|nr:transporter substrate-binding domain-containing protein [Deltaproteobacteria bacterium]
MARWLFIILFTLLTPSICFSETILLGAENDWVPYANQDGTGMSNDIVRSAFKAVGIDVKFRVAPYNRLLKDVREGTLLGAFNVPREPSNEDEFIFGKTPLFIARSAYYENRERPLSATRKEDLKNGEKVGVVFEYGYGEFFTGNDAVEKVAVKSDLLNLRKLARGRIDATILYEKTARKLIKENNLSDKIQKAFESETADIFVAFSKTFPNAQDYADKLDEGLARIKADGTYDAILQKY